MIHAWAPAVLPTLVSILLVLIPGLAVVWAGWGLRRPELLLLAPAISVAIYGGSAVVAPWVGLSWSLLPPAILSAAVATAAYFLRRRTDSTPSTGTWGLYAITGAALVTAAALILLQFMWAFISPESIAQRFDNVVHLNSVQFALETGNVSPFHIGKTSDIGFYPNGWHALTALTAQVSGVDVVVAVNTTNLAIAALVWPASNMALAAALFGARTVPMVAAAALSTGLGAFPALFFDWGVLYPNALGYSVVPATLAAVVLLFSSVGAAARVRDSLLLLLIAAGMTLAHPNALLAGLLFGVLLATGLSVREALSEHKRVAWIRAAVIAASGVLACIALWVYARTPAQHSPWPPYQNPPQAFGSALLISPRGFMPSVVIVVLLVAGFIAIARSPRLIPLGLPFVASIVLFVLVSGFPIDHPLRVALTNPWYSDPNRLAALLPAASIPVMVAGASLIAAAIARGARALSSPRLSAAARRVGGAVMGVVGFLLIFTVAGGPSVTHHLEQVRGAYQSTETSSLLSPNERALLDRLSEHVPPDALIIGSPRTGTSLAYAISGRQVTEKHIFGSPSRDELFLDEHLKDVESDPRVCAAVNRVGVDYVLDFGSFDVNLTNDPHGYDGVVELTPSERLVLVDSEGDARLFRIEGC